MRRVNVRPLVFIFVALCLGLLVSRQVLSLNFFAIGFVCLLSILALLWAILPFYAKNKNAIVSINETQKLHSQNSRRAVTLFLSAVFLLFGIFLPLFVAENWDKNPASHGTIVVQGVIDSSSMVQDNLLLVLNNLSFDSVSVPRKLSVFAFNMSKSDLPVGSQVRFEANIENVLLFEDGIFSYGYKNNIRYQAMATNSIEIIKLSTRFDEQIRLKVADILQKYLTKENAAIAIGAIFGDKSMISELNMTSFQTTGIAHILSVSGLHVSFLCFLIFFLLGKFKLKTKHKLIIVFVILLFYSWICGFSSSVVRSSLMSIFVLFALATGKEYDALTSISLAGLIILLFKPLSVYDAGFLLSFGCVISMILLQKPISNLLHKILYGKKLCDALAVTLSIQIGIFPLSVAFFGGFNVLSVFANLLCVPLFAVFYCLLIILTLITLCLPFMGFLMFFPDIIMKVIIIISTTIASIPNSFFQIFHFDQILVFGFCICVVLCSRFVNFKLKFKPLLCLASALVLCIVSLLYHIPQGYGNGQLTFVSMPSGQSTLIEGANGKFDLIDFGEKYLWERRLDSFLHERKVFEIETLFLLNSAIEELTPEFLAKYSIENVVVYGVSESSDLLFDNSYCKTKLIEEEFVTKEFASYYFVRNDTETLGMFVTSFGKSIFVPSSDFEAEDTIFLTAAYPIINIFDARSLIFSLPEGVCDKAILPFSPKSSISGILEANDCWTINLKTDTIIIEERWQNIEI